jgi:hypothetical protein
MASQNGFYATIRDIVVCHHRVPCYRPLEWLTARLRIYVLILGIVVYQCIYTVYTV